MLGVSVVIPCYNAAKYLRQAIESALEQEYDGPLEVVVADDGSDDGSYQIGESFGAAVRMLSKPPEAKRGASMALNRGIRAAGQPLIAILAADDVFLPGHLAAVGAEFEQRPEVGLVYDNGYFASADLTTIRPILPESHAPSLTPDDLLPGQSFGACSVVVRRDVFDRVGLFDETLRHAEDHDMWLRIFEKYPAAYVPCFGFKYRLHGEQKSLKVTLWEDVAKVFSDACARYPYSRRSIRKRKAVLAYRFGEIAMAERRFIRGMLLLLKAAVLDPVRAIQEGWRGLAGIARGGISK